MEMDMEMEDRRESLREVSEGVGIAMGFVFPLD